MFWIGFIVGIAGMTVITSIAIGFVIWCCKIAGISWKDFNNLLEANEAALYNRDSRIEVWCGNTDEKVFETELKYPRSYKVEE